MRLLMTWAAPGGGAARAMTMLANGLVRARHDVMVVVPQELSEPNALQASIVVLGSRSPQRVLSGLVGALHRYRPDVLIAGQQQMNVAALLARLSVRVRPHTIIIQHNQLSAVANRDPRLRVMPTLARWLYPRADRIVAVSQGVAADLVALGVRRPATVIYNGLDLAEIARLAAADPMHPWLDPGSPPVILATGRLAPQKDYPTLLRAFSLVRAQRPCRLVILGDGPLWPELQQIARELPSIDTYRPDSDIFFAGHARNPFAYMARAACFVLSSAWEGFGLALAEALSCGCPVVSTDCRSGPREILDGGRYGRLVPVADVEGLAKAIEATLDTAPNRGTLKARAAEFSEEVMVQRYLQVVEKAQRPTARGQSS
jgi:glycosyltransferase involved in cell wall biosynthesis